MTRYFSPGSKSSGGCKPKKPLNAQALEELVEKYREDQKDPDGRFECLRGLLKHYRGMKSLNEVIENAARARNCKGKRHGHQRRISIRAMEQALKILKAELRNEDSYNSFEALHDWFATKCSKENHPPTKGLGPLYVYDTCLRIGAYLKLAPKKVYLHAGALDGARALGIAVKVKELPVSVFPPAMRILKPHEIEDFLCVYKDQLGKFKP